ncbi:MAG: reductive dehalogenase [Proteobacteria bacterium]|nr:reductive dehalogenase [Pseudomonadota bacterium]
MLFQLLLVFDGLLFLFALVLFKESIQEQEKRASKIGGLLMLITLGLGYVIFAFPILDEAIAMVFGVLLVIGLALCLPGPQNAKALKGAIGYMVDVVERLDENYSVFVRTRGLKEGTEPYNTFYTENPNLEEKDKIRRAKGLLGKLGSIDKGYQPNTSMVHAAFDIPNYLGQQAKAEPDPQVQPAGLSPETASNIIKNYALHLGATLAGICEVNKSWAYSKRGEIHYQNWEDWGKPIEDLPKYAVVFLLEMDRDHVISAPHTPSVAESAVNYAKGAYIATILARWFSHMGYRGVAEHTRNYDLILPPLAQDAGLGEVGRLGYLIAPKHGARVRVFATLTDMPLVPDKPISLGVEEFCEKCLKCADSCPSRSIPTGPKTVCRGVEKWKLDEDSCFEYWARVGTDCSICMAICPFSRPDTHFHRMIRWFVAHSPLAKSLFPYLDNIIYGKRWKSRIVPDWLSYPKRSESEDYPTSLNDNNY